MLRCRLGQTVHCQIGQEAKIENVFITGTVLSARLDLRLKKIIEYRKRDTTQQKQTAAHPETKLGRKKLMITEVVE
jgi:hypothetical protein